VSPEPEDGDNWAPWQDQLPAKAIPVFGFRLVAFLDEDGQAGTHWSRVQMGEITAAHVFGDIVAAALEGLHLHLHEEDPTFGK
jgi:hypothetical protein